MNSHTASASLRWCLLTALALAVTSTVAFAGPSGDSPHFKQQFRALDKQVRAIKADTIKLQAQLDTLREQAQYPARSRWIVFVTSGKVAADSLQSLALSVDGHRVASHDYSKQERKALEDQGAQRLYIGNLANGTHHVEVAINGKQRQLTFDVNKSTGPRLLELHWYSGQNDQPQMRHSGHADTP